MAQHIPDLVRDSKLEVQVYRRHVIQVDYVSNPELGHRRVRVEQTWQTARRLGSGAFGVVWLEECTSGPEHGKVRAVKEIWKDKSTSTSAIEYSRELEAIAKFSQPRYRDCFVHSFGWYETDDAVFIAMEYFPNGDLNRYIKTPLPNNEARVIIRQLLEGLEFMHENQFAHRDLKPANILVLHTGPEWWVKIADFGISKRIDSTALRTQVGTPAYLAPEVLGFKVDPNSGSTEPFSLAVDIWSIGAIAFQIMTGRIAFLTTEDVRKYIDQPSSMAIPASVNDECSDFIQKTLASSPKRRPTSNEALSHPWVKESTVTPINKTGVENRPVVGTSGPNVVSTTASNSWSTYRGEETVLPLRQHDLPHTDDAASEQNTDQVFSAGFISLQPTQELTGHGSKVSSVAFSPDGRRLASGSADMTVRVWAPDSSGLLELVQNLTGHQGEVLSVVFSPDGRRLASGSADETVRVWAPESKGLLQLAQELTGHRGIVRSVAFSPDGRRLASGTTGRTVQVWAPDNKGLLQLAQELAGHQGIVSSVAFSPDGRRLASGSTDKTVRVWAPDSNGLLQLAQELTGHQGTVRSVVFSPDGWRLASGSWDKTVRVWVPDSKGLLQLAQELTGRRNVWSVAFSPDGWRLATGSTDRLVRVWAPDSNGLLELVQNLTGHQGDVRSVAFSPDGRRLASGSADMTVRVWAPDSREVSKP